MKGRLIAVSVVGLFLVSLLSSSVVANPPEPIPWHDCAGGDQACGASAAGGLVIEPVQLRLDHPEALPASAPVAAASTAQGWTNIMTEDFDGVFPGPGWTVFDNDGPVNGEYYWGDTGCFDRGASGNRTAIPHGAGADAMFPCWHPYPPNMDSWMVYGPFDLSAATDAELIFDLYLDTEIHSDYLFWGVSIDGRSFDGHWASGVTGAWVPITLSLSNDPDLGDYTGESQVWIAFVFWSDDHDTDHSGAWVDDVVLRARVGDCPGAATLTYITDTDNEDNNLTGTPDHDMGRTNHDCIYNERDKPQCLAPPDSRAPIEFNIFVDSLPPSITSAQLSLLAWDVDEEGDPSNPSRPVELDKVYFNGHFVGTLTGADQAYSTSVFDINPLWVKQGKNLVQVDVDTLDGCWCVMIEWGQLILNGGGGAASIRYAYNDRTCYAPGDTVNILIEVDTALPSQEVRVETSLIDPNNVTVAATTRTFTTYGSQDDSFVESLTLPANAVSGTYTKRVIVYDTCSETQNDIWTHTAEVDPSCGLVTPVVTETPTPTATPTKTPTPTPDPCSVGGSKTAHPNQVEPGGETEVKITLHGYGDCPERVQNVDVMLIIDRSGSMGGTPMQDAKNAAKAFVDMLDLSPGGDRVGVVSFETSAHLDHSLSSNGASVKSAIDDLSVAGFTNIGDGIHLANQELGQNGRAEAVWIAILLTDGLPNRPYGSGGDFNEPDAQYSRQRAAEGRAAGITLHTISLGSGISHYFLDDKPASGHTYNPGDPAGHPYNHDGLAYVGGGRYYAAPTSDELEEIYQGIAGVISAEPWTTGTLVDVLSDDVTYVPGSASPPPYSISADNKTLTWRIPLIRRNETVEFTYRVRISQTAQGRVCCNDSTEGGYNDSNGQPATISIPPACVSVVAPKPDPCSVEGNKTASPAEVQAGAETTVVITLRGLGDCPEAAQDVDVMLIIDRSGSMGGTPMQDAKNAAKAFVDMLDLSPGRDRVGVISYANSARLDHSLSSNGASVKSAIDGLSATGATNIGDGIHLANQELMQNGRAEAAWITILLTDGLPNKPYGPGSGFHEPDAQYSRQRAAEGRAAGITLHTISLGSGISHYFLDDKPASQHDYNPGDPAGHPYNHDGLAYVGGGRYYAAPTGDELEEIYQGIAGVLSAEPWTTGTLVDVLSDDVTYVPGSASPPPYSISADNKTLTWRIPLIRRNETKKFTYRVRISQTAQGQVVCCNDSTEGSYNDSNGQPATISIPPACVSVKSALHDVYCKDHPTDDGRIPSNRHGEDWWVSPDIWVRHQQDGGQVHQNPQGGQTNYVYVRVRNRGNTTLTNVKVDLYWAVGAASIRWPDEWTYINTATIPSIAAGQVRVVSIPWQPAASGHYCFLARLHHATLDPVRHEGLVPFDNNLCQRNIHVLDPQERWHDNEIVIGNPYGSPVQTDIKLDSNRFPTTGAVTVSIDQDTFDRWQDNGGQVNGGQVVPGTTDIAINISPQGGGSIGASIIGIPLAPNQRTAVGLQLDAPGDTKPQLAVKQMIDGEAVGGSVYRPPDPPPVYLPLVLKRAG